MNTTDQLINPEFPEFGSRFDTNRDKFTAFQAAMLWTGQEPAEDGMFRDDMDARWQLDKYRENYSVYLALIAAIDHNEFSIIPMRTKAGEVDGFATSIPREQLKEWAKKRGETPGFLSATVEPQARFEATDDATTPAKPVQRTAAQDAAILCELKKQGYDPLALPKNPVGKPGAKAAIRNALSTNSLFHGSKIFDKAWERLTANADIVIQG